MSIIITFADKQYYFTPNMKYLLTSLLFVFVIFKSYPQIKMAGSYAITAICKDGIVMGADTRGTFLLKNTDSVLAYYDTIPKIFVIRNCILNVMGLVGLGDRFMSSYIDEFSLSLHDNLPPQDCLRQLSIFLNSKYPQYSNDILKLKMFAIGYQGDSAILCNMNGNSGMCAIDLGIGMADTLTNFGDNRKYDNEYCIKKKCTQVAKLIEKEILSYAIKQSKTDKVGGPIMLIMVGRDNKITWLNHKSPHNKFDTVSELFKAYILGKNKINFKSDEAKKYVYNAFYPTK